MFRTIMLVAVGGAVGSVFRYLTSVLVSKYFIGSFPLATFLTNVVGCFIIGISIGLLQKYNLTDSGLKWLLVTGFCGGYTTFSAFGYENVTLLQCNNAATAFLYIASSIIAGLVAVYVGLLVSQ